MFKPSTIFLVLCLTAIGVIAVISLAGVARTTGDLVGTVMFSNVMQRAVLPLAASLVAVGISFTIAKDLFVREMGTWRERA